MTHFVRRSRALVWPLLPSVALAAVASAEEPTVLQEVVITASGFEQAVTDAPASVTVIDGEELARSGATSLSEALRGVQGVVTTGVAAEQDISIRGLPGQYTLILVDGKRQGTREARPNGSAGFEQNMIPPISAIERIEVVRGPMSSLYGSDAMGGVVNIITKKVADSWGGSVSVNTTIPEHDQDGATREGQFYLNGPLVADTLGLQLWGRKLDRAESKILNGNQDSSEYDLTGRLTWTPTPDQDVMLEAGHTNIERRSTPGRTLESDADRDRQDNERTHWSLTHVGRWAGATTELSFAREMGKRTTYSLVDGALETDVRQPRITNDSLDAKVTAPLTWRGEHTLVAGLQWQRSELDDLNPGLDDDVRMSFSADQWAIYAEDQWNLTPDLALTIGGRWTDHELFGSELTPRVYAVWHANPNLTVKGGVSTGYRTPDLRQMVPGYYYTTQRGAGVIVSNPDLKPESSVNYELGAIWEQDASKFSVTAFQTDFEDKIESYNTGDRIIVGGHEYYHWAYRNIQNARIRGVELTGETELTDALSVRASYTYTDSEQLSGDYEGLPLTRTPRHMANLRFDWQTPITELDSWASVNYHGKEVNAGARIGTNGTPAAWDDAGNPIAYAYDAYTTVDVGASYSFNDSVTLDAAIYNLFDEKVVPDEHNTYEEGRRLWVGLTSTF